MPTIDGLADELDDRLRLAEPSRFGGSRGQSSSNEREFIMAERTVQNVGRGKAQKRRAKRAKAKAAPAGRSLVNPDREYQIGDNTVPGEVAASLITGRQVLLVPLIKRIGGGKKLTQIELLGVVGVLGGLIEARAQDRADVEAASLLTAHYQRALEELRAQTTATITKTLEGPSE